MKINSSSSCGIFNVMNEELDHINFPYQIDNQNTFVSKTFRKKSKSVSPPKQAALHPTRPSSIPLQLCQEVGLTIVRQRVYPTILLWSSSEQDIQSLRAAPIRIIQFQSVQIDLSIPIQSLCKSIKFPMTESSSTSGGDRLPNRFPCTGRKNRSS